MGCQESRQEVLAYSLILIEIQRIAHSPMAFVGVCPCVCLFVYVCVSVCIRLFERLIEGPQEKRLREIRNCFNIMLTIKTPSNNIFGDVVARNINLLFEDSNKVHLDELDCIENGDNSGKRHYCLKY